jgi:hypothetical protein
MSISTLCGCGKRLKFKDSAAGKRVKCSACGQSMRLEAADAEEPPAEEAAPKKKRGKTKPKVKREHAKESWLQRTILGMRVGGWLVAFGVLGGLALATVLILPKAVPSLGSEPYYTLQAATDHVIVTIHNTEVGDIPVTLKKRSIRTQFDGGLGGVALPEYEMPTVSRKEKTARGGKTVSWEIECTKENGVTEVRCDDKKLRISHW